MKISEITEAIVKEYLNSDEDELILLPIFMDGAKNYIKSYTGIPTDGDLDLYPDLTIAYLAHIQDSFDNRGTTVQFDKSNKLIDNILGLYSRNLL
ncbi:head-tail connector protein [Clostridium estertheticum]|uniref:head-tail connector protein n=1 Tax=Clostridium estertheticum TaxID=238834 RepID=UPI001C6E08D0|nr:head-tail connector protein [Clostridium estertheticum]MBW9170774.1 head-tail connector protein [Clostridium estertheticum]WLC74387.1 head-tail connector protein [Clostridium estertheticum]